MHDTIRFNTFRGKDKREWLNLIIIGPERVFQVFCETKDFPISIDEFTDYEWEIKNSVVQFKNAFVTLVAGNDKELSLFCKIII